MAAGSDQEHLPVNANKLGGGSQVIREETPILRDLLGLGSQPSIFGAVRQPALLFGSGGIKDVLFLSINIKGSICGPTLPGQFQIGLSILDTTQLRDLKFEHTQSRRHGNDYHPEDILQTYNLYQSTPLYRHKIRQKTLFGTFEDILVEELDAEIQALISGRHVILVVHGGLNDLRFLERLKIKIKPIFTIDTQKAAQNPLRLEKRPSLEALLTILDIPFHPNSLDVGGNDANYALRVLLMIAVAATTVEGLSREQVATLEVLRDIARSTIPQEKEFRPMQMPGKGRAARLEAKEKKRERMDLKKKVRERKMEKMEEDNE
jgi:hypothetical protein